MTSLKNAKKKDSKYRVIRFHPDNRTIIKFGNSHFSWMSDSIAEFTDNSIDDCNKEESRDIAISFYVDKNNTGFLLILDNRSGIRCDELEVFATFAKP